MKFINLSCITLCSLIALSFIGCSEVLMMLRKKHVFFYGYSIVLIIYTYNVRVTDGEQPRFGGPGLGGKSEKNGSDVNTSDVHSNLELMFTIAPMYFITVPYTMVFEGVDYDHLKVINEQLYDDYYDCFYWYTHCVRDMTYIHTICAYNYYKGWVSFNNHCQMELENCRYRTEELKWEKSTGIYGTAAGDENDYWYLMFYHGDGENCKYNFRRNGDRVNFYFEDQYRRIMREIEEN